MKKLSAIILALMIFTSIELFALEIDIKLPSTAAWSGIVTQTDIDSFKTQLISDDLAKLGHQNKLATGFGNAVAYSANSASFSGYEGYDIFAFMWGLAVGVKLPSSTGIGDNFKDEQDFDFGLGASTAFNLGINLTALGLDLLPNRLYMNIKGSKLSSDVEDWSFKMTTFGMGLNYQVVDRGGDRFKLFKWTGLSVGTGFLYNRNKLIFNYELGTQRYDIAGAGPTPTNNYQLRFTPDTQFGLDVKTYTIPIEASTSVRLLWLFNFTFGAGLDLTFGSSKIIAKAESDVYLYDSSGVQQGGPNDKGTAIIDGSTSDKPTFLNPKIMAGFGICLGPLPIDVRITYYPGRNGIAANIGTGIVW
ncbi:MAG: hypothetical protein FWH53_06935 [Leptospirales bacterium]|nr:hypothetical protein [Leptospirales bacterium]